MTKPRPSTPATGRADSPAAGALARLHDATAPGLYALALRITGAAGAAEEVVEQTLIEAWRADPAAAPELPFAALARRCRDLALVRSGKRSAGSVRQRRSAWSPAVTRERSAAPGAGHAAAANAMARLGEEDRRVLEMAYFEGYSVADMAVCARSTPEAVVARLRRAIAAFAGPGPASGRLALSAAPARLGLALRARLLAAAARDA
jgi:RNA polymerase sigma-70 factor (ECF subfamily)